MVHDCYPSHPLRNILLGNSPKKTCGKKEMILHFKQLFIRTPKVCFGKSKKTPLFLPSDEVVRNTSCSVAMWELLDGQRSFTSWKSHPSFWSHRFLGGLWKPGRGCFETTKHMDVSKNGGTQQPWVFLPNMIIFGVFWRYPYFWKHPCISPMICIKGGVFNVCFLFLLVVVERCFWICLTPKLSETYTLWCQMCPNRFCSDRW